MKAARAFYIIQGNLQVCEQGRSTAARTLSFADNDEGLQQFEAYIAASDSRQSLILIDVIEEVFVMDTIPRLGGADRKALLAKRVQRKFPRTPFRLAVAEAAKLVGGGDQKVVYSSISNHELLDPWLAVIAKYRVPLTGIFSLPLMASQVFDRMYKGPTPVLYISQHQGDKIRQVFVQDGLVKSARLSKSPNVDEDTYPQAVITEIQRSRRYLERSRVLSSMEQLDVCMVTPARVAEQIVALAESQSPLQLHFVEPQTAARKLGVSKSTPVDRMEALYVSSALNSRPKHSYAVSGETRYWLMSGMRRGIIGATLATAAACSVVAGINFSQAWRLYRGSAEIDGQVTQLSEAYRRENDSYAIKADSYEMKLAVDTGDYILEQRVPVPWVMQQLGTVLGSYPDVRLTQLAWEAETNTIAEPARQRPGEAPKPVPIPATISVSAELTAKLVPFDGDMRRAFARIDELVEDISANTAFTDSWALEYPIDANVRSILSGQFSKDDVPAEAQFKLRLNYPLQAGSSRGASDDDV